jgi:hypothetical protein
MAHEKTAIPPVVGMAPDRGERREIPRQQAPLAAARGDVLDRVNHIAQVRRARAAKATRTWTQRRDQAPLPLGQVA